jgi:carnitine 3-dehydrogenase
MEALGKQNKGKGWGAGELYNGYTKQLSKLASKKPKPALKSKVEKSAAKAKATKPVKKVAKKAGKKKG